MENTIFYILDDKKPVLASTYQQFAEWISNPKNKVISRETLPNKVFVSTLFTGISSTFGSGNTFETMAFDEYGTPIGRDTYSTWEEAEDGHKAMVKKILLS